MKFYEDSQGTYWLNGKTVPAGQYVLDPSDDELSISLYPYDRQSNKNLLAVYNKLVTEFQKEDESYYSDYSELYSSINGFFKRSTISDSLDYSKNIELAVSQGLLSGYSTVSKFGVNLDVDTSTDPEDVWEFGGTYIYDDYGTAPIMYLSSSSTLDTQIVSVQGLDIDGYLTIQEITLTGQTNVLLTTPLWRVFRMENNGTTDINGVVYCHTDSAPTLGVPEDDNVRAIINGDKNQTLMAIYTIPKGKVGFLYGFEVGVELEGNAATLSEYAHFHIVGRNTGKVFQVKKAVTVMVSQGVYQDVRAFPAPAPALLDIKLVADVVSQDMGVWGAFNLMLVDEDEFSTEYLENIGQPGY